MATEAQTLANRRNAQKLTGRRSLSMNLASPADYFMQNKPNFRKTKININSALTKGYENEPHLQPPPKQTQSNPISKAAAVIKTGTRLFQSRLRTLIFADIEHEELRNLLITKELQRHMAHCRTAFS